MVMIPHQAKRMNLPVGLKTGLSEGPEEVIPVHVVKEDVVALVATAHDVIHRTRVLQSHLARHIGQSLGLILAKRGSEMKNIYGLTPHPASPASCVEHSVMNFR